MDPVTIGALIAGGSSLLGGIFNRSSQESINQQNIANQQAINAQNIAEQEKFAQNTIQWKVADANKAGINPLAALGASTSSFSNIAGSTSLADKSLGESMGSAGQAIGRAVAAQSPTALRAAELENKLLEAKIANVNSDTVKNQSDTSQIATRLGAPGLPPGVPMPRSDPRGPVIELYQRARDYHTGEIYDIPSEKAASPLQTLAASPTNISMAAQTAAGNLAKAPQDLWSRFVSSGSRGDAWRASIPLSDQFYTPF